MTAANNRDGPTPKRRRLSPSSTRSSSPDELSTTPYTESKRPSYSAKPLQRTQTRFRYTADDIDDSPDELDDTVHTFYRRRQDRDSHDASALDNAQSSGDDEEDRSMHTPRSQMSETPDEESEQVEPIRQRTPKEKWRNYKLKMVLKGHRRGVAQVRFSPNGKKIASCSADATIRIWNAGTGEMLHVLEGHLAGISTIAWSPDSVTLASGSDDKSIRLWNTETGKPYPVPLIGHHNYVYSIAFSPKGNMIVSGSYDEAVFLWDVRGARVMRSLPAHSDPVGGVDFVRDGTLIVSCAGDGLIRVWDTASGQCLKTLVQEDREPVSSVIFSPNGKYVLAWTLDSCLRLWNYVEGRCLKTYQGHKNSKYSINGIFGTYGEENTDVYVATGSEDGKIVFWDITTKEVLQTLEAHAGVVLGLGYLPGENLLVSGGIDGVVTVWEVEKLTDIPYDDDHDVAMTTT